MQAMFLVIFMSFWEGAAIFAFGHTNRVQLLPGLSVLKNAVFS